MAAKTTKRIVVTGANKGIGRATVERILGEHPETYVYLGSRNKQRGEAARAEMLSQHPDFESRCQVLELDVSQDESARAAAAAVEGPLYGLVNNAGIGIGGENLERVLQVNSYGPHRVYEAFSGHLKSGGRVVIVSSAAGPNFVSRCSAEKQRFFLRRDLSWKELDDFMTQCIGLRDAADFEVRGLGDGNAYGLSKACANAYMQILARTRPDLMVNSCTPGFILTDLTHTYAQSQSKSPRELGMKTPHQGAKATLHLLFGDLPASGRYYGSDAERSPLDRYRSPGDPPFDGD